MEVYGLEEKKAIEELESLSPSEQSIETILNLIEKQNRAINTMAEQLTTPLHDKEWIINYYTKLVEEGNN